MSSLNSLEKEPDFAAMNARLQDAVAQTRRRQRSKRVLYTSAGVTLGATLLAGSFWYTQTEYQHRYTAECYTEPSLSADSLVSYMIPDEVDSQMTSRVDLAADACAASWHAGVIGQPRGIPLENKYPIPELQVCQDRWGALKVFPSGDDGICATLSLTEPTD